MRAVIGLITLTLPLLLGCQGPEARPRGANEPLSGFFENGGVRLSYRLDRPAATGRVPAIVLGHGSGRVTKDDAQLLASGLLLRGFAVLRYDKRGVGDSTGVYSGVGPRNSEQMIDDLAGDMAAAVSMLRARSDISGSGIGLMGASQAGWIIPLAARRVRPAFMIIISGPAVSVGEEIYYSRFAEETADPLDHAYDELTRFTGMRGFDPVPILSGLEVPGLWLLGQDDRSIPERNTARILRELITRGRPFAVVEYPRAGHSLFDAATGAPVDYWPDIDRWLARR